MHRVYVLPDAEAVRQLQLAIRRMGDNINQLVRHAHRAGVKPVDIDEVRRHLAALEDEIIYALQTPPELLDVVDRALQERPELAGEIKAILALHEQTN